MKFGVMNEPTTVNRFVLHTLQRNITHLAIVTRKTYIKLGILKGGKLEKSRKVKQQNCSRISQRHVACKNVVKFVHLYPLKRFNTVCIVKKYFK